MEINKFVQKDCNEVQVNVSGIELGIDHDPINVDGSSRKKVHQFYFVKFSPYEDLNENDNVRYKIEETENLIAKINEEELLFFEKHKKRIQSDRYRLLSSQYRKLCYRGASRYTHDQITWKLDHLQEALGKLNFAKNANQRIAINSCSSREVTNFMLHRPNNSAAKKHLLREINEAQQRGAVGAFPSEEKHSEFIWWLYHRIESQSNHEVRNTIVKEIKQFEHEEKKAVENANTKGKNENPLLSRKAIQDQIRLINKISEELRKERLKEIAELEVVDKDINISRKKLNDLRQRRDDAERHIQNMRRQQNEAKSRYYRYVSVLRTARELATKKEVKALQDLSLKEIDNFMSQWNNKSKVFRCDYKKMMLTSLHHRQLSSDGRIRNLDEEPLKPPLKHLHKSPYTRN
ncbi:hypothetical protein Ddye_018621 [Dipteronia dyeriana]|uniref:Uncharacterized protein n=1 Tax=Dipteronia dyeriana TaxID=168575 RepID=A0AAD9UBJ6_9ROSI|nr:hypothetical protein Ddye_018621 [Dipteronia dyeriana]